MGFQYFERFVGQCGGIDGDFRPHFPRGVVQGLLHGHAREVFPAAERAAACGDQERRHLVLPLLFEQFVDGAVLAVDRNDGSMMFPGQIKEERTAADDAFLVRQSQVDAFFQDADASRKSAETADAVEDDIAGDFLQKLSETAEILVLDQKCTGLEFLAQCFQSRYVGMGGKADDLKGKMERADGIERRRSD